MQEKHQRDASPERRLTPTNDYTVADDTLIWKRLKKLPYLEQILFCAEEAYVRDRSREFWHRPARSKPRLSSVKENLYNLPDSIPWETRIMAHVFAQLMWTEICGKPVSVRPFDTIGIRFTIQNRYYIITQDTLYFETMDSRGLWRAQRDVLIDQPSASFRQIVESFVQKVDEIHTGLKDPIGLLNQ